MRRTLNLSKTKNESNCDNVEADDFVRMAIVFGKRKKTRNESLAGAKGPVTEVLMEGWLEKRGEKLGMDWKKRYFLLEYGVLWYYKEKPSDEQRESWKKSKSAGGGGTSPRRPGDAAKFSPPPEMKGGQKTLGFFLLNNAIVEMRHSDEGFTISLQGPLIDHHTDWSWDSKVLRLRKDDVEKEGWNWLSKLRKAVPYESTLKFFDKLPISTAHEEPPHPMPDHIGQILFLNRRPNKLSASEILELAKTEFAAEEGVYAVLVLPADTKLVAAGISFKDDKEKILYGVSDEENDTYVQEGVILEVDGERFQYPDDTYGAERPGELGYMYGHTRVIDAHPALKELCFRNGVDTPEEELGFDLIFRVVEEKYSGRKCPLKVQYYTKLDLDVGRSRFYRYLAEGQCSVEFDDSLPGPRLEAVKRDLDGGGGGGGDDDDDGGSGYNNNNNDDDDYEKPSYKSPTSSKKVVETKKPVAKKPEPKKPEPKKPEPKKVEKKLSECYNCKGSGKTRCLCTQGTKSDTAKCSKCKGSGLGSGKCMTCNGVGKK